VENIKENIAGNLAKLRREHKMTQQELASKLNYSDKAVSRWEHAETLPDIETLCKICALYGVKFEYLLQKEQPHGNPYVVRTDLPQKIITMFIAAISVWIAVIVAYIYMNIFFGKNMWTLFIWAIPVTATICQISNKFFFANRPLGCVLNSVAMWTLLLALYLQLLPYNIWMLFIIGAPIQAVIILVTVMNIARNSSS